MRLLLLTNMPSYHQMDLGRALAAELGSENFRLVFHHPTSDERREMGWQDAEQAPWLLRYWQSDAAKQETAEWLENADVVVQGRFPLDLVRPRIRAGKLTFCYQERFWKRRFALYKVLLRLPRIYTRYWSLNRPNYHLLAAGAFVAPELQQLGVFKGRSWKYGYFIAPLGETPVRETIGPMQLLWCARFSSLKQPEHALQILAALVEAGHPCHLHMVGDGELRKQCERWVTDQGLADYVWFHGWQDEQAVAGRMQAADALLMTSSHREGWALVINEAMRNGCAIVAQRSIGAVPWLVQHGKTGLVYDDGDLAPLIANLAKLTRDDLQRMGESGREFHQNVWSAQVAARRLHSLSEALTSDPDTAAQLFPAGPCSSA